MSDERVLKEGVGFICKIMETDSDPIFVVFPFFLIGADKGVRFTFRFG